MEKVFDGISAELDSYDGKWYRIWIVRGLDSNKWSVHSMYGPREFTSPPHGEYWTMEYGATRDSKETYDYKEACEIVENKITHLCDDKDYYLEKITFHAEITEEMTEDYEEDSAGNDTEEESADNKEE